MKSYAERYLELHQRFPELVPTKNGERLTRLTFTQFGTVRTSWGWGLYESVETKQKRHHIVEGEEGALALCFMQGNRAVNKTPVYFTEHEDLLTYLENNYAAARPSNS